MPEGSVVTDTTGNYQFKITYLGGSSMDDVVLNYLGTTVTGVSPTSGPSSGLNSVVITGTNFTDATAVSFGGTAAISFVVNSVSQITAVAPARERNGGSYGNNPWRHFRT